MKKKIEPVILKGTRDFLPVDMSQRNRVLTTIKDVFEKFGYQPIETPILNYAETILGKDGENSQKMAYSFKDYGERDIALPFDLTMPFARFVAANWQDLPMPFKRYQVQRVWRAERPQRGRLREFYQCDVDIIGSKEVICEAEIAKLVTRVFDELKIKDIKIRVNSRKLLNEILLAFGVAEANVVPAIRLIDKLDKIGEGAVTKGLQDIGVKNAAEIIDVLKPAENNQTTLNQLGQYDTSDLEEFLRLCEEFSVEDGKIVVDPSLARGLDYYTGIIFEAMSADTSLGTICAGGRYDDLAGMFSSKDFSGVGVSFGFERIMMLMADLGLLSDGKPSSRVLVTVFDENSKNQAIKIYKSLLKANVPAEIYLDDAKLSKQLKFADKKNIPFVVVQGPDELKSGELIVRRMSSGNQKTIPTSQLASYIAGYYEAQ